MSSFTPTYLYDKEIRQYIIKNNLYLKNRLPDYFIKSLMTHGRKAQAERLLTQILLRLKHVGNLLGLFTQITDSFAAPIELSPVRMGKKVKMIPRISSLYRQTKRSIYMLSTEARTRKFINKSSLNKIYREIIAGLFFYQDSFRQNQNWAVLTTGYFNLRYLNKRWF
jgi:ribosomal protein S7